MTHTRTSLCLALMVVLSPSISAQDDAKPRARDAGVHIGILPTGPGNSITDVKGVTVGHKTVWQRDSIRTGVTVVLPHSGNLFAEKVPAAIYLGNAFGKLAGFTQVEELGNIEAPIALTSTLSVSAAVQALVRYTLQQPGNESVRSVNVVVGETNDGFLNDIRGMHVTEDHVMTAIQAANSGPVPEGTVGAGTGTVCFGFKGGIGTSSRRLPAKLGGHTVGVLVQSNYGGILTINGAPVGRELGQFTFKEHVQKEDDGSCMIVVATDAPLSSRSLKRLAKRAILGLVRTGSFLANGSGDYSIAFSTAYRIRQEAGAQAPAPALLSNAQLNPLFLASVEATEEAVLNSLFKATAVTGRDGHKVDALPVNRVIEICHQYRVLNLQDRLPGIGDD